MKIALIAGRMPPACDGVGDHADRLARSLSERDHEVVALTVAPADEPADYRMAFVGSSWGPGAAARVAQFIISERPDAVVVEYTPFLYGPRSAVPMAALVTARFANVRSAIIVHEAFYPRNSDAVGSAWKASLLEARDRWTLAQANCIAVPSEARAATIARRMPSAQSRLMVLPIGANVEAPPTYRRNPVRPSRIVAFGVVAPRRRIESAIEALAQLAAGGRDVYLDVIGRIYDQKYASEMVTLAAARGVGDRVVFHGELPAARLSAALAEATVALHAAREGAIPSSGSLIAMLAHAVPVVALRTLHDDDLFAGALHYADDDRSLVAALRALVDEPAAATSLMAAGAALWRSHFGWDRVADRLLDVLVEGDKRVRVVAT